MATRLQTASWITRACKTSINGRDESRRPLQTPLFLKLVKRKVKTKNWEIIHTHGMRKICKYCTLLPY
jgi:hypothetical protein